MGSEMIAKATDSFERKQRRCLDRLDEVNLFSGAPQLSVAVLAVPTANHVFKLEDKYRLAIIDDAVMVIAGVRAVGRLENPPASVLDAMRTTRISAVGQVVRVFDLAGKAELRLE